MLVSHQDWRTCSPNEDSDIYKRIHRGECTIETASNHMTWFARFRARVSTSLCDRLSAFYIAYDLYEELRPMIRGVCLAILREEFKTGATIEFSDDGTHITIKE